MVMRFRSGGAPSSRFHVAGLAPAAASVAVPLPALMRPGEETDEPRERTTWFMSSLELREGCEVHELPDESIDRIVL